MKVIVLQGVSGSGKSTYARWLIGLQRHLGGIVLSTDDFFGRGEEYKRKFMPARLPEAHAWNFRRFLDVLREDAVDLVVVDNTNTRGIEISPYMAGAAAYGFEAEIHYVKCDLEVAIARATHNVPSDFIRGMQDRIEAETFPPRWKKKVVEFVYGRYVVTE